MNIPKTGPHIDNSQANSKIYIVSSECETGDSKRQALLEKVIKVIV